MIDPAPRVRTLAEFAVGTGAADLPDDVADYTKLVLLDSLVCGIAAAPLERSGTVQRLAARYGGPPDSTVFGLTGKVAAINAAHANAEMMNALDADDTFFNSAHFAVFGVAAALADGERVRCSGAELIRAVALAFEINARLNLSTSLMGYDGDDFVWSQLSSHGYGAFGAAAACGVVAADDVETVTQALSLASWLAPTARNTFASERRSYASFKYGPYGAIAQAGVQAADLAREGYVGDLDALDREPGFIRAQGYLGEDRRELVAGLGERWWIMDTSLKPYPACRFTHAALDALSGFLADEALAVDDLGSIVVRMSPAAYRHRMFAEPAPTLEPDALAPLNGAFHIPYQIAMVLRGFPPGPEWYRPDRLTDPVTWDLARLVTTAPDPELHEEWKRDLAEHPGGQIRRTRGSLTIVAKGREYRLESDFADGDPWSTRTRADWDFVTRKFGAFCGRTVGTAVRDRLVRVIRGLESVDDVAETVGPALRACWSAALTPAAAR